ncbi:MAG: hypothetical protein ACI4F2_06385 [Acutalibacteraceae bacterium]
MTPFPVPSKIVTHLIRATKFRKIEWISMDTLKGCLKNRRLSLRDVTPIHIFLEHLQEDKFIFECFNTYITCFYNTIYIFSKSKYSSVFRLDMMSTEESTPKWSQLKTNPSLLLRLRNAIVITNNHTSNCDKLLYALSTSSIASSCVV